MRPKPPNNEPLAYWDSASGGTPPRWWLYHRYVQQRRPVTSIAEELGRSVSGIHVILKRYEIPLRGRGDVKAWKQLLTREWLLEMLDAGMSMRAMARHTGAAEKTIMRALHRHRLVAPGCAPTTELIRMMHEAGRTIPEIAHSLRLHPRTVRDKMLRADIQPHPPGRRKVSSAG